MLPFIPSYTAPSTANIASGLTNASADVRNLVEVSGGPNDRLTQLSNNVLRVLTTANDGITLDQNQDTTVLCNADSALFGFTLPPLSGQYKPIYFEKTDNNSRWITINANGTDKITSLSANELVPAQSDIKLYVGGMSFVLYPTSNGWRHAHLNVPAVDFRVRMSANQSLSAGVGQVTAFDTVVKDTNNFYDTGTRRYIPKIPGTFLLTASVLINSGTSSAILTNLRKGTAPSDNRGQVNFPATPDLLTLAVSKPDIAFNGVSDYIESFTQSSASRTISADSPNDRLTYFSGKWLSF